MAETVAEVLARLAAERGLEGDDPVLLLAGLARSGVVVPKAALDMLRRHAEECGADYEAMLKRYVAAKAGGFVELLLSCPALPEDLPDRQRSGACLFEPREPDMSDCLLICPNCGWLYLDVVEDGKLAVCGMPRCRCQLLRAATAEERATLPVGATVGPPKQDVLLKDSRRFYAVEKTRGYEVYDNYIDDRDPKSLIMEDVTAEAVDAMTEGFLKTVTPAREVEVAVVVDLGRFLTGVFSGRIPAVARDDPFLVGLVSNRGAKMGMTVVTVPASWESGDSDLHEAGWFIDRRGEVEEVCKVAPRIMADGTMYRPKPKEVFEAGRRRGDEHDGD